MAGCLAVAAGALLALALWRLRVDVDARERRVMRDAEAAAARAGETGEE